MAKKIGNLAVKTGEYTPDGSDKPKGTYEQIGSLMQNDQGNEFLLIKKYINFSGFNNDNKDSIAISIFRDTDKKEG